MPRQPKCRYVSELPGVIFFKPAGTPMRKLHVVSLTIDEYEAIRWADTKNLQHNEAAERMRVSRPTFTRILASARRKVATAIVEGRALRIDGGNFKLDHSHFERLIDEEQS